MKTKLFAYSVVVGLAFGMTAVWAGPHETKAKGQTAQATQAKTSCDQGCGGKQAATDGRSEAVAGQPGGCAGGCAGGSPCAQQQASGCAKAAGEGAGQGCACGGKKASGESGGQGCACGKQKPGDQTAGAGGCGGTGGCGQAGACGGQGGCKGAEGEAGSPIDQKVNAVLASMPGMKYRVGDEVLGCPKRAASLAQSSGRTVEYVVGEETFANRGDAAVKLAALLDDKAKSLPKIEYMAGGQAHCCPKGAAKTAETAHTAITYRVAGFEFTKEEDAQKAVASVREALDHVALAYEVDDQGYDGPDKAAAASQKAGKDVTYVVGSEKTGSKETAGLLLAEARIRAAVEAVAKVFAETAS